MIIEFVVTISSMVWVFYCFYEFCYDDCYNYFMKKVVCKTEGNPNV